jgi:hypothetical protein
LRSAEAAEERTVAGGEFVDTEDLTVVVKADGVADCDRVEFGEHDTKMLNGAQPAG